MRSFALLAGVAIWFGSIALTSILSSCASEETAPESSATSESQLPNSIDTVSFKNSRDFTNERVEEDGLEFTTRLRIEGHKDETMEVLVDGDNGKLLGHAEVRCTYEATKWDELSIFVPESLLIGMREESGFDIYVVSAGDPEHYLQHTRYQPSNLKQPDILWIWKIGYDNARLTDGQQGLRVIFSLNIKGHKDESLETYLLVTEDNDNLSELEADLGGPIQIKGPEIRASYDSSLFDGNLEFDVPYSILKRVPPNRRLVVTPAILVNGELVVGNVHTRTWAGGPTKDVQQVLSAQVQHYDQPIQQLQQEMEMLKGEIAQ